MNIDETDKIINKHYTLFDKQNQSYKEGNFSKCIDYCIKDIKLFNEFKEAYIMQERQMCINSFTGKFDRPFNPSLVVLPFFPAFVTLIKVYEKQGLYDKAIEVCNIAIEYGLHDNTKGDFIGRINKLEKKKTQVPKNTLAKELVKESTNKELVANVSSTLPDSIKSLPWYISISFGKSTSENFAKAMFLAKSSNYFLETQIEETEIYQAFFTADAQSYLKFVQLYELVGNWKSSFVIINGELVDRKIVGGLNYCYGDRCRSGRNDFCFGASFMTKNPFGCHRLQISAGNSPWWSFSILQGGNYIIDKTAIMTRAMEYGTAYRVCPCYNHEYVINTINNLPNSLSYKQYQNACNSNGNWGTNSINTQFNINGSSNVAGLITKLKKLFK